MPLHPLLQKEISSLRPVPDRMPILELRMSAAGSNGGDALKREVRKIENRMIDGPAGPLGVRIYWPFDESLRPAYLHFHGGGFCLHTLDTRDAACRAICIESRSVVIAATYRKAPENPFPAAVDDAVAAAEWLIDRAADLSIDGTRLFIGGDSAGGCLAAAVQIALATTRPGSFQGQILFYPMLDHYSGNWKSYETYANGFGLTGGRIAWFWDNYVHPVHANDPLVSPYRAPDHSVFAPTYVSVAQYDVLRDEGEHFAASLNDSGVETELEVTLGLNHGYLRWVHVIDCVDQSVAKACAWMRARSV